MAKKGSKLVNRTPEDIQALASKIANNEDIMHSEGVRELVEFVGEMTRDMMNEENERAVNVNLISELNNIDFQKMIGGPLQAAVQAQVASSMATVNFIKEVGFEKDEDGVPTDKLVMADFSYKKTGINGADIITTVSVPLITIVTVPSLRIENIDIQFNAKLNSVETEDISSKLKIGAELGVKWGPVNFKATMSYQRSTSRGTKVEKEYSLNVKVQATQDEMPAGLEQVLGLLAS